MSSSDSLRDAAKELSEAVDALSFGPPTAFVYNPLDYAWSIHEQYLKLAGKGKKKVVFLGMNPGPFGMAQTGVPFGEIPAVRDWMGLSGEVGKPSPEHPKRQVEEWPAPRARSAEGACGACSRSVLEKPRISLRITSWPTTVPWSSWRKEEGTGRR